MAAKDLGPMQLLALNSAFKKAKGEDPGMPDRDVIIDAVKDADDAIAALRKTFGSSADSRIALVRKHLEAKKGKEYADELWADISKVG